MAQLTDDSQQVSAVDSTEILSPQPFAPPGKGFLVSSLEYSNEPSAHDYDYNSSSSSTRHSTIDVFGREVDDELEHLKSRASSRSSLSSLPTSVRIHSVQKMNEMSDMDIHEKLAGYRIEQSEASFGEFEDTPANLRTIRQREAAFRKPSSVRAMQMHTEDEADDDEYLTPPRRRAVFRSPGSSPLKRSPYYSATASKQPKPKKEAPLVLLHCTLLPPSIPVPGASDPRNQEILEDELPAEYWRRWRRLQECVGSGVVRDRGVLISHPQDLYDMLEERLLESLELVRPRLQNGHFIGREEHSSASGSEGELSDVGESETDGEQGDECPDCGSHVRHGDSNRKWEVRVFAANGLMRAGAWAAAWRDMEKVDVEVGLWLPSDVRRSLERRLAEAQMIVAEQVQAQGQGQTAQMQIASLANVEHGFPLGSLQSPRQSHARMVSDVGSFRSDGVSFRQAFPGVEARVQPVPDVRSQKKEHEVALSTLLFNYIRVLAADRRNLALLFLSALVAFLAMGSRQRLYSDPASFSQGLPHGSGASSPSLDLSDVSSVSHVSLASSLVASDMLISSSVASLPTSESVITPEAEEIHIFSQSIEPTSLHLTFPGPTTSVESSETSASPQFQSQLDPLLSLPSAGALKSPATPEDIPDSSVDTVEHSVVSSEQLPIAADSTFTSEEPIKSTANIPSGLEETADTTLEATVQSLIAPAEPNPLSIGETPALPDGPVKTIQAQSQYSEEELAYTIWNGEEE
ncbi:uncharacterized protein N7515_007471 [Penicillium bovifimosum]|uniref:Uncharacterized protein n=1 Tax=Penicillium bovifimosum TaxID=126998 RepID=A0A9W9L280_9EURO|nr:uncharacterized protein N7515_007471 [Penicillium bovifimosum]KAJ5131432.1 hypothetical protein N7515_007471 [Penicillium bovifimosum]